MPASLFILAPIIFVAFTTEATAGFGSSIIALTIGAHFFAIGELVPVVVLLNVGLTIYMVSRYHSHVSIRLLLTIILPLMGIGLAAGQLVFHLLSGAHLQIGLAILVIFVAGRELWLMRAAAKQPKPLARAERTVWLLGAGIIHGMYATGGPPLVYVVGRAGLDKLAFRSTMATIWLILDFVLVASFVATGVLDESGLERAGWLLPVVIAAIVCGEVLHRKIPERPFRRIVFALLLVAGTALLF